MSIVKKILKEAAGEPMIFLHGGNLDDYDDNIAQKNGRYEYGPGLYLTTSLDVAMKYAKGRRKLYKVTVQPGVDINQAEVPLQSVVSFVKMYGIASLRKQMIETFIKYAPDGVVKAYQVNVILLNNKAIKPANTYHLRQFYIDNGIDYEIVHNAFGWGEEMMVLYNMKKVVKAEQISLDQAMQLFKS